MINPRRRVQLLHALEVTLRVLRGEHGNLWLIADMEEVRDFFRDQVEPDTLTARWDAIANGIKCCLLDAGELLEIARKRNSKQNKGAAMSNNDPVGTCDECGENIYEHELEDREEDDDDEPLICSECTARKRSPAP